MYSWRTVCVCPSRSMTGGRLSAMHASPSSASSLSDGVRHRFARSKNIFGVPQPLFFKTTGQPTNFVKNRHRAKVALCSLLNHRLRRFARICLFWRSFSSGNCTPSNIRRHVRHVNAMKTPGNRRSPPRESSCPRAAKSRHPAAAGAGRATPRKAAQPPPPPAMKRLALLLPLLALAERASAEGGCFLKDWA